MPDSRHGGRAPRDRAGGQTRFDAIVAEAARLDALDAPYSNARPPSDSGGYDCSSTCAQLLKAAGYGVPYFNTATAPDYMEPGQDPSGRLTFWNNDRSRTAGNLVHMFAQINGRDFGTSSSNPGGGPGYAPHTKTGFDPFHVSGLDETAEGTVGSSAGGEAATPTNAIGIVAGEGLDLAAKVAEAVVNAVWDALGENGARILLYIVLVGGGAAGVVFGVNRALGVRGGQPA